MRKARVAQGALIASGLMAGAALFGILTAVLRLPTVGAPIQYMSVGKEYRVETVVEGDTVRDKYGGFFSSCDEVKSTCTAEGACNVLYKEGQKCNELLSPTLFVEDEKGRPVFDVEMLKEADALRIRMKKGISAVGMPSVDIGTMKGSAFFELDELEALTASIRGEDRPSYAVVGARSLLKVVSVLRRPLLLNHQIVFFANEDAQKAAQDTAKAAKDADTDEARAKAAVAKADADAAAKTLEKAKADKDAILAAIVDARAVHESLHPEYRHPWYEGGMGRGLGFLMLIVLGFGCYLLARKGAQWELAKSKEDA